MTIGIEDYIKANKKLAREEELERNGGRWVAKDRPHKNLKKYDRKRDKKNYNSFLSLSFYDNPALKAHSFRGGMKTQTDASRYWYSLFVSKHFSVFVDVN